MEESLKTLVYVIGGLLFWVGPFLLRMMKKRRLVEKMEPPAAEPVRETPRRQVQEPSPRPFERSTEEPVPGLGQRELLARRARDAAGRAQDLERKCRRSDHGRDLAGTVNSACVAPLLAMASKLEATGRPGEATSAGIGLAHGDLVRMEGRLATMEALFEGREALRDSKALLVLDTFVGDTLTPYILHARRVGLSTRPLVPAVSPAGTPGAEGFGGEGGIRLSSDDVGRPSRWAVLASSCASAFAESCGSFFPRVCLDLGFPDPRGGVEYFFASGRLTLQVVVSGWMPWIFGDVCAAVQLGPAFALGLVSSSFDGDGAEAAIDDQLRFGPPPLHVRVFAAVSVLNRLGLEEDADRLWKNWLSSPGSTDSVTLRTGRFGEMALPADRLLGAVGQAVDLLLARPLSSLGGYGITQIDGLRWTPERLETTERAARALIRGDAPVGSPLEIMGAAAIASGSRSLSTSRLVREVEASILGKAPARAPESGAVDEHIGPVTDLSKIFSSRKSLAEVVGICAAVAPVRGGRSSAGSV